MKDAVMHGKPPEQGLISFHLINLVSSYLVSSVLGTMLDSGCIFLSKAVLVTELMQPIVEETEITHRMAHLFHNSKYTMRGLFSVLWEHVTEDQTLR